ncbi:MAG: AI-2E family transporter [Alkalibacterium sp.]|uniref:AI-2E family transporter n=1 Tax=Alkalibacterium sp. TaxID=1872447 RepID=UPI003970BB8D
MINWKESKLMFWTVWLLAVAILIYLLQRIDFILNPLMGILTALFMPLLLAGFLYYLLNPLVKLLERFRVKRIVGIIIVMILLVGFIVISILLGIPMLIEQTSNLISGIPELISGLEIYTNRLAEEPWMQQIDINLALENLEMWMRDIGSRFLTGIVSGAGSAIQAFTEVAFLLITVPVILFYMLHDGKKFLPHVVDIVPLKYKRNVKEIIMKTDDTISSYISGKGLASLLVGVLLFLLYSVVNLPSAFLLSIFAAITNFIPIIGPFIGAGPAIVVGLIESPARAILVAIFVLIAQQLDSNFFTPLLVGKSLAIHPLTVILVLLASAKIAGLIGMLIGVPLFAILKTIGTYLFKMYREEKLTKYSSLEKK